MLEETDAEACINHFPRRFAAKTLRLFFFFFFFFLLSFLYV